MDKSKAVAIYRCRRCGKEFEKPATMLEDISGDNIPQGPVYMYHQCNDEAYGLGDLTGGYVRES